jgi:TonB family protein
VLSPTAFHNLLAQGNQIDAPDAVQHQMMRDEKRKASAVVKVCIGIGGDVTTASIVRSSGYQAYDDRLIAGVRGWRYRAYIDGGHAVPACSAVAFSYTLK